MHVVDIIAENKIFDKNVVHDDCKRVNFIRRMMQ